MADPMDMQIDSGTSPQAMTLRRRLAEKLAMQGMDSSPISSPWQGVNRIAQAVIGGMEMGGAETRERAAEDARTKTLLGLLPGGAETPSPTAAGATAEGAIPGVQMPGTTQPGAGAGGPGGARPVTGASQGMDPATAQRIRQLLSNPSTRAEGSKLLMASLVPPKPTDEMREYALAQQQGETRSFTDWKSGLKAAGATHVNIDQTGEKSFSKKTGELQAGEFQELVKRGRDAKAIISDLTALREIGSRITTGKTAEITQALGPYAEALGVKIDGLEDMQAFKAITSRLAPRMRAPGSGATSDFEMRTFLDALPTLGRTPGGNEIVANVFQALQENDIRTAEIASQALAGEMSPKDAEKQIRALPNPFAAYTAAYGRKPTGQAGGDTPDADGWRTLPNGVRVRER